MREGDWVETPMGTGVIMAAMGRDDRWTFGRPPRRTQLYLIRYPRGKRHVWAADRIRVIERGGAG